MVLSLQKGLEIDIWKGSMIIIHLLLHTYHTHTVAWTEKSYFQNMILQVV